MSGISEIESCVRVQPTDLLRFETFISDLSARFVKLPSSKVHSEIEFALRDVTEFFHAHRCGLLDVFSDQKVAQLTHVWYAEGVRRVSPGSNCAEGFSWTFEKLVAQKQIVAFNDLSELPPDAADDLPAYRVMGAHSSLMIPLFTGEEVRHIVILQSMDGGGTLSKEYIPRLRVLAEILVNALERKNAEEQLRQALDEVRQLRDRLEHENTHLRQEVKQMYGPSRIVGQSAAIRRVLAQVERVAVTGSTVLLLGETGTGKELFASAIHELSPRKNRTMIRMNCAAIPAPLIESELFGREKGAYTGAISKQIGRFEMAHGSTLFLDEIGELPIDIQVKLLRVLEEKSVERLGNPKPVAVDVRIIAATNKDLEKAVREGKFREDLYYRLNVFPVMIPPLRERREDIPLLTRAFVEEFSTTLGKHVDAMPQSDIDTLMQYAWPGNIRELRNIIERSMILAINSKLKVAVPNGSNGRSIPSLALEDVERRHMLGILKMTGWRVRGRDGAAEILGLKPTTLSSRMTKLGIRRPPS
jgi:formate hydrogenlyase transcriptional activator